MATFSFLLSRCSDHFDLHSFPTRRSSDLDPPAAGRHPAPLLRQAHDEHGPAPLPGRRDRKSTRLNSSHSQISYAVFRVRKQPTATKEIQYLNAKGALTYTDSPGNHVLYGN